MACCTVVIFSASSSGISVSNSSSSAMTSSTVSRESAPRSSTNDDSFLISASFTPSCSATIFLTRCSTFSMLLPPLRDLNVQSGRFYQNGCAFPLLHIHTAVDMQSRAGDIRRRGRGEKRHGVRHVLRRSKASKRDALDQFRALRLVQRACHVGVDEARRNTVHRNLATADFLGQ